MSWARATLAVVVAGLVGVIALPEAGGPVPEPDGPTREEVHALGGSALEALRALRGAVEAFRIDHGAWPGWDGSDAPSSCAEVFAQQLTAGSEEDEVPYLPAGLPINPLNGLATVRVLGEDEPWPLSADDRTGWIYDPRSGLVKLNSQGRLEDSGVRYFDR